MLAVASCLPAWMSQYGLVQFYGQDIDPTCALMAQINCRLYGLNGYSLRVAVELNAALPPIEAPRAEEDAGTLSAPAGIIVQPALFEIDYAQ